MVSKPTVLLDLSPLHMLGKLAWHIITWSSVGALTIICLLFHYLWQEYETIEYLNVKKEASMTITSKEHAFLVSFHVHCSMTILLQSSINYYCVNIAPMV